MNARPRLIAGALTALGLVIACQQLTISYSTLMSTNSSCEEIRTWAVDYLKERSAAPTLEELAQLDRSHRLAVFTLLSPIVKATLVRDQVERLARQDGVSNSQRALIAEALPLMTPALYGQDADARARWDRIRPRILRAFPTSDVHAKGWYELGSVVPGGSTVQSVAGCNCNVYTGECGCLTVSCSIKVMGCGWGALEECNGRCP